MGTERHFLDYELHLSDQAEVELRRSQRTRWNMPRNDINGTLRTVTLFGIPMGGTGFLMCGPERAIAEYGGVMVRYGETRPTNPPFITSPWLFPVSAPDRYPTNVDYTVKKSGGWFGIHALFGDTDYFSWRGTYVYEPSTTPTNGGTQIPTPQPIWRRRWADGFELPSHGEGSSAGESALSLFVSRDASRTPDGLGLRLVEPINATKKHNVNEFRAGFTTKRSWERLYIRINTAPTAAFEFWQAENSGGGLNGVGLQVLPSGALGIVDISNAGVRNLLASSSPLTLGRYYRLDLLFTTGDDPLGPTFKLYLNRVLAVNVVGFSASGWGVAGNHVSSLLGNELALTAGISIDFDDWISMDYPSVLDDELSLDWLNGSHVVRINPTAFGPNHDAGNWGANKTADQLQAVPGNELNTNDFQSAIAGSRLEVTTDVVFQIGANPKALGAGIVALTVGMLNQKNAGGADGTLSFARNGGAYVDTVIVQAAAMNWDNVAYLPNAITAPEALTSLSLKYTIPDALSNRFVRALGAAAEILGVFGPEDLPPTAAGTAPVISTVYPKAGTHNAPYERSPWAYSTGIAPISPVIIHSGTYVGNGTTQTLKFKAPVNWLWVRRVDVISSGARWWSSMVAPIRGAEQPYSPEGVISAVYQFISPPPPPGEDQQEAECVIRIVGNDNNANLTGATYQYVAFEDPGMRFCLNGCLQHNRGTVDRTSTLFKSLFQPIAAFLHRHTHAGATNVSSYYKGPGHAAQSISDLDSAEIANAFQLNQGSVMSRSALVPGAGSGGDQDLSFSLWRKDDLTGDPGIPNTVQIFSYTGDGSASRTINLAGTTKRPLFALVTPHNGATLFRDPSHLGTTSSTISTADSLLPNAATGIVGGGPGQLNVGSALNSNGIVYDVFIIMGGDTACNGGFSCNGEFAPVEPTGPPDWPDDPPIPDDEDEEDLVPDDGGTGGGGGGGGDDPAGEDFGTQCVEASTKVCNQALAYIGVTQRITDIVNETTVEAEQCRLHYADAVNEALREFPWAFATKYAAPLTLLAGVDSDNPVNNDWIFAYAVPSDLIYARRIINVEDDTRRGFDNDPPQFRMGTATIGGVDTHVIFCDTEDAELEYTYRPSCAASRGDALFRNALSWLVASKLAPGLARNKVTSADAFRMFLEQVARAKTMSMREQQPNPDASGDAPWLRERD